MAKEVAGYLKLQVPGGAAKPAPPIGPALGSRGVNIQEFCKQFNARTQDLTGKILPVVITIYTSSSCIEGFLETQIGICGSQSYTSRDVDVGSGARDSSGKVARS